MRRWAVALTVVALSIDLAARAVQHLAVGSDRAAAAPAHVKGGAGLAEAAAGPALSGPALRWGMHGRAVEALQAALSLIGYDPGRPDGAFAAGTRTALTSFQRDGGMEPDGVVSEETGRRIRSALARRARADALAAARGLQVALTAGRLTNGEADRAQATLARVERTVAESPLQRAAPVAAVLRDVAAAPADYDRPRVTALWATLSMNLRPPPGIPRDVTGPDGVVYRWMPGEGYQFHPLANFALLNAEVSRGERERARLLAGALLARGARDGGGMVWEYDFPFGGPSRWTSGFAQAVAADALARAGKLVDDRRLTDAAKDAFNALDPALTRPIAGGGRWILEYSKSDMLVLNADLESLLSLRRYARTSGSGNAARLADQLDTALHRLLPRFDTGCWSRYSLGGAPASRSYHAYHVQLLRRLFAVTGDPLWRRYADRFGRDLRTPSC